MSKRLNILHLSDIHITGSERAFLSDRAAMVAAAVNAVAQQPTELIVAITGDVAFSGKTPEYALAAELLTQLERELVRIPNVSIIGRVVAPGNHDCNFSNDTQARDIVIASLATTNPSLIDESVIETVTHIQDDFFAFAEDFEQRPIARAERVYRTVTVQSSTGPLTLHILNTAFMSKVHERQGELAFPYGAVSKRTNALEIVLFHHPYNWLDANNARLVRAKLESVGDVMLTGHEHESSVFERRVVGGDGAVYVEGGVLLETGSARSGFNILEFDDDMVSARVYEYTWDGDMYRPRQEPIWTEITRRSVAAYGRLQVKDDFLEDFIFDPGSPFSHPHKSRLRLDDIFVPPDLNERSLLDSLKTRKIPSTDSERYCQEASHIVIIGPEDSGKTALLKRLYKSHLAAGRLPLWLSGEDLKRSEADYVTRAIDRAVGRQYGEEAVEQFRQVRSDEKVLLVDDLHRAKGNKKAHDALIVILTGLAKRIVLSADEFYELERVAELGEEHALGDFSGVTIRPFGYQLRGELIDRWLRLGRELTISDADLAHEISRKENAVNTLMGRSLFPSYPLFILTVLQTIEAMMNLNTASVGTYGYVYEALITAKLSGSTQISVDTKYNFLAFLAFGMFSRGERVVAASTLAAINDQYFTAFRIRLPLEALIAEFTSADLLINVGDGVAFKYKYVYYYFIARSFAQGLADPEVELDLRRTLDGLIAELYQEDNANILLFLLYLTKDRKVLDSMFSRVSAVYESVPPSRFENDVEFVARLNSQKLPLSLPASPIEEHRKAQRAKLDAEELSQTEDKQYGHLLSLNVAMKSIQILGQVLRNFAGSLPGKLKAQIAGQVAALGFRTVAAMYGIFEPQLDTLRTEIRRLLIEREVASDDTVDAKADRFIFQLIVLFGQAIIRKVSAAIGSEELSETYHDLLTENNSIAMRLLDAAIQLEHFKFIDAEALERLLYEIGNNSAAVAILRQLVWDRLYLFPVDFKSRQRLCKSFAIEDSPALINPTAKKIK